MIVLFKHTTSHRPGWAVWGAAPSFFLSSQLQKLTIFAAEAGLRLGNGKVVNQRGCNLQFGSKWGRLVTRVWFNVASRVQPRRLIDCWNSNLQLVINTLLIAYWFPYSYSLLTHYSVFTTHYLLFTEYVRFGPLLTYSWYKSSSVIQQEHWCLLHWYSFLPESSSWGRLFVYIQTSDIRIRDILQNEKNFKSFLVSRICL